MPVQGILESIDCVHIYYMPWKAIPTVHNSVCKKVLEGSGITLNFSYFVTVRTSYGISELKKKI